MVILFNICIVAKMKVQCKTALNRLLSGVSCLLLFAGTIQAQDRSPVGDWNCVISGSRSGLAYLSFSSVSNGGGASVLAVEQDDDRLIDGPQARLRNGHL